jgi:hypothetical protein
MKTTTQNQVQEYLQWSTEEYEDRLILSIMTWCQHRGMSPSIVQQLLANSSLNNWFMTQYHKCELQFLKIVEVIPPQPDQLLSHYKACTAQMMIKYPMSIIQNIKRNKDFSNQLLSHTPIYYAN